MFWPSIFAECAEASKGTAQTTTAWKECNKYDRTAAPYFWLANHMIGPGGLLSVEFHFVFRGGVAKKLNN